MGILYQTVKRSQEVKRQIMIKDLLVLGFTEDKKGRYVTDLSYYDLQHELDQEKLKKALRIRVESSEEKWF
jgi:hypothetical protein